MPDDQIQTQSPDVSAAIPDQQMQTLDQPGQQAAAPPAAPEQKQPFWKTLLQGALNGIAGSAGAHNWGQALGMGVRGEQQAQQLQFQNQMATQQQDTQQQAAQASIKFRDAQSALNAAQLANWGHQLNTADRAAQDAHDEVAMKFIDRAQKNGQTFRFIPGAQSMDHLAQQSVNSPDGAAVPSGALVTSQGVWVPNTDAESYAQSAYNDLKTLGPYYGLSAPERGGFIAAKPAEREKQIQILNFLRQGRTASGAPMDPKQVDTAIGTVQLQMKRAASDPNAETILPSLQNTLQFLQVAKLGSNNYLDAQMGRQKEVAATRATAFNQSRVVDAIDPETGEARPMTNAQRLGNGAVAMQPGMKAGQAQAQLSDIESGSKSMRQAINKLDTPLSPEQIATLSIAMGHGDPGVVSNEIKSWLGTQRLSPQQRDFVVAVAQLNERAMSLRSLAGMGQGSDQLRAAILATLPSAASGDRDMMTKQLNAFDQQVQQLGSGIPKVAGLAGHTRGGGNQQSAPSRPAGVPANATWNPQGNNGRGSWKVQ